MSKEKEDVFEGDLDNLFANLGDSDDLVKRVEAMRDGGGEVIEASSECEGGCKI